MFRLTQAVSLMCGGNKAFGPSTGAPGRLCREDRLSSLSSWESAELLIGFHIIDAEAWKKLRGTGPHPLTQRVVGKTSKCKR